MAKLRVHNFAISLDGYAAGPDQGPDDPLGVGGTRLHEWVFASRAGRKMLGMDGGDESIDDAFITVGDEGIDATIIGRNMFGPIRGPWPDENWKGWWGDEPPYASTIQQYLGAGLIDEMHVAIVPILLGRGERLFDHLDGGPVGYECAELVSSPSVVHAILRRAKNTV